MISRGLCYFRAMTDVSQEQSQEHSRSGPAERVGEVAARPFLKWAGGKAQLVPEILQRIPSDIATYYEPFLGGGAVFFALRPARAVLSDINPDLINAFEVVRDKPTELIESLSKHRHSKSYFYKLRGADRSADFWVNSDVDKASRVIYLNKTCYNGLYRVNSRGEFNVPFGDYQNPKIVDDENISACSAALQSAEIVNEPFESIADRVTEGDFVYCDPPYVPASRTANFAGYTKEGFPDEMHRRLAEFCRVIDRKGARFLLSNSDTPLTRELYAAFHVETVEAPRAINSKADRRGRVTEILVRNYEMP